MVHIAKNKNICEQRKDTLERSNRFMTRNELTLPFVAIYNVARPIITVCLTPWSLFATSVHYVHMDNAKHTHNDDDNDIEGHPDDEVGEDTIMVILDRLATDV